MLQLTHMHKLKGVMIGKTNHNYMAYRNSKQLNILKVKNNCNCNLEISTAPTKAKSWKPPRLIFIGSYPKQNR